MINLRAHSIRMKIFMESTIFLSNFVKGSVHMFKVIFTVIDVPKPKSVNGKPTHVTNPCKIYNAGDKMTVTSNPGRIVLEETDSVCLAALSAILP